jgi:hypothetical protein
MSEQLNKYIELDNQFLESLIRYTDLKNRFIRRPSVDGTKALRSELKKMRNLLKDIHATAQLRRAEYSIEWRQEVKEKRKPK